MENIIYYGTILEVHYNGGMIYGLTRGKIGMDAVQAVKYVYRKVETTNDISYMENVRQIKENLKKIGYWVIN